jgi:hypothetical protein
MNYWKKRENLRYYKIVRDWIEEASPGGSILDVGPANTPVATWGDFQKRYTVDRSYDPELPGVTSYVADFLEWEPPRVQAPMYDVVTCLQVLEHLQNHEVGPFTRKLTHISGTLIVSVPYLWPRKITKSHHQDPVSIEKFHSWWPKPPQSVRIINDRGLNRLVARFGWPLDHGGEHGEAQEE